MAILALRPNLDATTWTDRELLTRVLRNEQRGWNELVRRYRALIFRCITKVTSKYAPNLSSADIDEVYAEQDPEEKLEIVRAVREHGDGTVVMAGDGINDAPALALADVGIAMAGKGATVSSETADVVVVVDRADRIPLSVRIGRRSLGIARQSVIAGLGLSVGAMVVV